MRHPKPSAAVHDAGRLGALRKTALLDTPTEAAFDRIAELAALALDAPAAAVNLVGSDRVFCKSCIGIPEPWASRRSFPLEYTYCRYVVESGEVLAIEDVRTHVSLRRLGAYEKLGIVAYAGAPLVDRSGHVLGTLCAMDYVPHHWTERDLELLVRLADATSREIELRETIRRQAKVLDRLRRRASKRAGDGGAVGDGGTGGDVEGDDAGGDRTPPGAGGAGVEGAAERRAAAGAPRGDDAEQRAHTEARLLEVMDTALENLPAEDLFPELMRTVQRAFGADTATMLLWTEDGHHLVPEASSGLEAEVWSNIVLPARDSIAGRIATSRKAIAVEDVPAADPASPYLRRVRSLAGVPLRVNGRALGGLHIGSFSHRRFTADELRALEEVGLRVARAVERALLLEREQRARERAERQVGQFALLAQVSEAIASATDYAATLQTVVDLVVGKICDYAVIDLRTDSGRLERVAGAAADPRNRELLMELLRHPVDPSRAAIADPHIVRRVFQERRAVLISQIGDEFLEAIAENEDHLRLLRAVQPREVISAPLTARGQVIGIIDLIATDPHRSYRQGDVTLAEEIGRRAGTAIDNARLHEEARAASVAKSDFLAVMSHELRTPLTGILGYTDLLLMGIPRRVPEEVRRQIGQIDANARHLLELIEEVLLLSRIEGRHEVPHSEPIDARVIAREMASRFEPRAVEKGLRFEVGLPDHPVPVETDPGMVRRILTSLLGNAVKFTDEGRVDLVVEPSPEGAVFRVTDTGPGIPAKDQARIFQPFTQVESPLTRRKGGTGLGLTIALRLARLLGGDISVESDVGRGSTFTLRLPNSPRTPQRGSAPPEPASPDAATPPAPGA